MNKNILSVILGALILSFTAFYNKFPLLTDYSGTYIDSGFNHTIPEGKTALYGFFVAHSSWAVSIWLVVFSQACLLSLLIFYFFRYFSSKEKYHVYYFSFLFFISFFMAASVSASTIGTGIFTGITVLATGLLLFAEKLAKPDRYIICFIALVGLGMNIINLVYALLILLIFAAIQIKKTSALDPIRTNWSRISVGAFIVLFAWLLVSGFHYGLGKGFTFVEKSELFARIAENTTGSFGDFLSTIFADSSLFFISDFPWTVRNTDSFTALHRWFNWELREGSLSQQYFRGLTFKALSYTQIVSSIACILYFIFVWIKRRKIKQYNIFIFCLVSFILLFCLNAVLFDGMNSQIWQLMWLLALPAFIYTSDYNLKDKTSSNKFFID